MTTHSLTSSTHKQRLTGTWSVFSVPLPDNLSTVPPTPPHALTVAECTHIQLALYPEQPYWGDDLREINKQAWIYRKTFVSPEQSFQRVRLEFEGVDYFAAVWLNDQWLGSHEGHFAPFRFDVTDYLRPSGQTNTITVKVSSPWDKPTKKGTYPTDHVLRGLVKGLYEHGEGVIPPNVNPLGIWRPVYLLLDDGVSIEHIRIRTELDGTVGLRLTLTNARADTWHGTLLLKVEAENHHGAGTESLQPIELSPGTHVIEHTLHVDDPQLWWSWDHGDSNLYRLTASLQDESSTIPSSVNQVFGIRTIRLERSPKRFVYLLNERPIAIRGSSYLPSVYLSECTEETFQRDLVLVRDANLNLLRVHVHVSPPELYDLCDRQGILIWQDFELSWMHEASIAFEDRARALQREMIAMLGNHPSIITWSCHNEPTMVFTRRENLEQHPDPALYADALEQDPTRAVFITSGQMEDDWRRSGDTHSYHGAIWTNHYIDVYRLRSHIASEFGVEAPAALETLQAMPFCWERMSHLEQQIDVLWEYQAKLVQYHVEHFRRSRATSCAGYIHFWFNDLFPQTGCGVLDSERRPKGGYHALRLASQPLHIALEHNGHKPIAVWVFNDTMSEYAGCSCRWQIFNHDDDVILEGQAECDVKPNAAQCVLAVSWDICPQDCAKIELALLDSTGQILTRNTYHEPFVHTGRPKGYPWNFDFVLGCKVFDQAGAQSLITLSSNRLYGIVPLRIREQIVEWVLRQHFPHRVTSWIARALKPLL